MKGMYIVNLTCSECGMTFPIPRKKSVRREAGHIKDLWCFKCKTTTKHLEPSDRYLEK